MEKPLAPVVIDNVTDYVQFVRQNCDAHTVYRGLPSWTYKLIPTLGRGFNGNIDLLRQTERDMLRMFRLESYPFVNQNYLPPYELMGLAQHHGLKTRLLDWTRSALIALYFACEKQSEEHAIVYMLPVRGFTFIDGLSAVEREPQDEIEDIFFLPLHSTRRITVQQGVFLSFQNPLQSFTHPELKAVVIPHEKGIKHSILYQLNLLGINRSMYVVRPKCTKI